MKPDVRLALADRKFDRFSWLKSFYSVEYSREVVLIRQNRSRRLRRASRRVGRVRCFCAWGWGNGASQTAKKSLVLAADPTSTQTAGDVASRGPLPMVFPDEPLAEVLRWAGDWPFLPVVNRGDLGKLEGVLTLANVLHTFRAAAE